MKGVTPELIKKLRERTGVGMGKCKEALVLAEGDLEKAIDHLRKAGLAAGAKKEGRETKEGLILTAENDASLAFVEANVETDFVAQNERFKKFVQDVVSQALVSKPASLEAFLAETSSHDSNVTIEQYRNLVIQALGENIQIKRLEVLTKDSNSSYGIYSHMGGRLVVVVEISGDAHVESVAKDIAMHIAAESPDYIQQSEIPKDVLAREEEIARSQVQGKPEHIIGKIVDGKLQAFAAQVCLLDQKFIKDTDLTIEEFLKKSSKEVGKDLKVKNFWRWKVGQ